MTLAGGAGAVHWPFFGGDPGRSGYQPVDKGGVPIAATYAKTADTGVQTSILTSAGIPSAQRMVYGTSNGRIHLQILEIGAAVGAEEGVDIANGDNADVFTGNGGSVTPADTSSGSGLGQLYVVHNDDNQGGGTDDIALAQIDTSTGAIVKDVPVAGTDGYTVSSSVIMTPANAGGGRSLFFVAGVGATTSLWKIAITNADAQASSIGTAQATLVTGLNLLASPTLVYLNNAAAAPTEYVAVAVGNTIRTFSTADLTEGPASSNLGGLTQTASVPVTTGGTTPGQTGSNRTVATSLFVAANAGSTSIVHKLVQQANALVATQTSAPLAGAPAPALAVTQEVAATGDPTGGRVILTTASNLFLLNADNLTAAGTFAAAAQASPTGFARTTAAASGDFIYVTRDNGQQLVLKLADAQPVTAAEFPQAAGNTGSTAAFGQPSLSRGFVQFASDKGAFVYRNRDLTAPTVALTAPAEGATISGTVTVTATAFDARGIAKVDFQIDGVTVATDTTGEGNAFATPGATFSATFNAATLQNGARKLRAVATDGGGVTGTAERTVTVTGGQSPPPPPPPPTPTPKPKPGLKPGNCANPKIGTARADVLRGTIAGDNIFGLGGNDTLAGLGGNDCLSGGTGNDVLVGGPGNDRLIGGTGNDTLVGGTGNDQLVGGTGTNRISGGPGSDRINSVNGRPETVNCGSGRDTAYIDKGKDRVIGCEVLFRR